MPAVTALVGITAGHAVPEALLPSFDLRTGSVVQFLPCLVVTALVAWRTETMVRALDARVHLRARLAGARAVAGAVSLLNVLIRSGSAVNVASLFYLTPPVTALIAWAMFGETLTGLALAGMAVTVFGCGWRASDAGRGLRRRCLRTRARCRARQA